MHNSHGPLGIRSNEAFFSQQLHSKLSMTRAAADQVFADYADRLRMFPRGNQRNLTADYDDLMKTYGCLSLTEQCHLIDNVYDRLGNSLAESDGVQRDGWDARPIKRRMS